MNQRAGPGQWRAATGPPHALGLVSVVIPAYNEEAAIAHDVEAVFAAMDENGYDYELLVVDDGSTDRTAAIVAQYPRARLVRHPVNMGVGSARSTGMRLAEGEIIVTTDGDGTYPNHEIPLLLARLVENDMVIGARTREAGTWPWLRAPAKAFIRSLAGYLTGRRIPDLNSGLRGYRKSLAGQFAALLPTGHSWESTITLAFLTAGYRVEFVPVDYYPRRGGRSSFHPVQDTLTYLRLVVRTVMYFNPMKFFGPIAVLLLAGGLCKFGWDTLVDRAPLDAVPLVLALSGVLVGVLGWIADLIVKRRARDTNGTNRNGSGNA